MLIDWQWDWDRLRFATEDHMGFDFLQLRQENDQMQATNFVIKINLEFKNTPKTEINILPLQTTNQA